MPSTLSKVTKKVSKKKGGINSLHENSRDSQKLRRASARDDRLTRVSAARAKLNQHYLQRVAFFQGASKAASAPIANDEARRLIESFIHRSNDELAQLEKERRPGRPKSSREDLLTQRINAEQREYDSGFWIPNIADADAIKKFRDWPGDWTSLANLKFVRLPRKGELHESSFPPKGQS